MVLSRNIKNVVDLNDFYSTSELKRDLVRNQKRLIAFKKMTDKQYSQKYELTTSRKRGISQINKRVAELKRKIRYRMRKGNK